MKPIDTSTDFVSTDSIILFGVVALVFGAFLELFTAGDEFELLERWQ